MKSYEILIVDDEKDIAQLIAESLEDEGYTTRFVHDGPAAIEAVAKRRPSLVLLDIWLGNQDWDGLRVLEDLRKSHDQLPIIMMSGHGTIETAVSALKKGAYDFIEKPFQMDCLLLSVKRALEMIRLKRENASLKNQDPLLMQDNLCLLLPPSVKTTLERLAVGNTRVLIEGGVGSGKSLAARYIHFCSKYKEGPLTMVSCAHDERQDLERLLFGQESEDTIIVGALESCHQGTLVLEDVGGCPPFIQERLMRFLSEGSFTRQGGHHSVSVSVRLLATNPKPLERQVEGGGFRQDLYDRLSVAKVHLPSLRERLGDFERIATTLLGLCYESQGIASKPLSKEALEALKRHPWPGELNELRNVLERAISTAVAEGLDVLTPEVLFHQGTPHLEPLTHGLMEHVMDLPLKNAREHFERSYLLAQVARFDGNISQTASFVGMERSALHRKLKGLKIDRSEK